MNTPWGKADHVDLVAPGITSVSTPSHGGYHLDPVRMSAVHARFPHFATFAGGPWFEEDCDWAVVALTFPELFDTEQLRAAVKTARRYSKDSDSSWASVVKWLDENLEGQSLETRIKVWERENAENWQSGSMGTPRDNRYANIIWFVNFTRIGDGAQRQVHMPYPEKCVFTTAELDALDCTLPPEPVKQRPAYAFNEADCGGTFDGFSVGSDADPGL